MKNYLFLILSVIRLVGCGGEMQTDDQVLECEMQGGEIVPYLVENMVTGDQFIYEQCEMEQVVPKSCRMAMCKPGSFNCPVVCPDE